MHALARAFETCSSVQMRHCWDGGRCIYFPHDEWRVIVAEGDCQNGESEGARLGCDCRVWLATHLSDLSDWIFVGSVKKSPGRSLYPISRPAPMQGWAAEAAAMLLLPTCLLALIGVFIATCVSRTNCSAFVENGSAAMQGNNSSLIKGMPCSHRMYERVSPSQDIADHLSLSQ